MRKALLAVITAVGLLYVPGIWSAPQSGSVGTIERSDWYDYLPDHLLLTDRPKQLSYLKYELGIEVPGLDRPRQELPSIMGGIGIPTTLGGTVAMSGGTTTPYTIRAAWEDEHEVETSMVTFKDNDGVTDYTVIGYMAECESPSGGCYLSKHATVMTGGGWVWGEIPRGSYPNSNDPVLAANLENTGVAPKRVYYANVLKQLSLNAPNAIGVSHSIDGGFTWSSPAIVEENLIDHNLFLDKPDMEVSHHPGTQGWVYVSYTAFDNQPLGGLHNAIKVSKSTDGGQSFSTPVTVANIGLLQSSQILVNPFFGRVYVFWVDHDANQIKMAFSDDFAVTWSSPETVASGMEMIRGNINGGVNAITVPQTRFNWVANRIAVVWHARESPQSDVDSFLALKSPSGWSGPIQIHQTATGDQFQPAIDFDTSGNFMAVFYDRSADPANISYEERWVRLDPAGNILETGLVANPTQTDPSVFPAGFAGDYQDIWWWNYNDVWGGRFHSVFAGTDPETGPLANIKLAAIKQP